MNLWQEKSVVSKLRIKGENLDPLAARLHFERLFAASNPIPEGFPPKAIICIKKLRDPAPQTLRLNRSDFRLSDAWQTAVKREIEKLYSRAFRPVSETIPAQAESIIFADDSELLACLASDWCEGVLAQKWWWRSLFPNLNQVETVAKIWTKAAEFVPNALQILSKKDKAVKFVGKLQTHETNNLLRQLIRVFGLNYLQSALFEPIENEQKFNDLSSENLTKESEQFLEKSFTDSTQKKYIWSQIVTETQEKVLNFEQQSLLKIGLMLARAPRIVRSAEFALQTKIFRYEFEFKQKFAVQGKKENLEQNKKIEEKQQEIKRLLIPKKKTENPQDLPESKIDEKQLSEKRSKKPTDSAEDLKSEVSRKEEFKEKPEKIIFEDSQTKNELGFEEIKTESSRTEKQTISKNDFQETFEEAELEFEFIIETRFGGVFYFLNLGLYLKLYSDFTESLAIEIDLNIWDFVALLGLEFLGEKIKNDAVWKLLETLAGHESDEELEKDFHAPEEWRMPREWLETFQTNEKWFWTKTENRLIIRHPEEFNVVDVKLAEDFQSQLEDGLKVYQKDFNELIESDLTPKNWWKNLTEYLQKRLLQALNLKTKEEIGEILLARKARVTVTATHLDVNFSLADLPISVRLAGIDRNPAWIQAAGKFVNFHFI